jgi:hypothetical protein
VGVGYLQAGENRGQGLPMIWEGFEAMTRWHGLRNTIRNQYTAKSQALGVGDASPDFAARSPRRRGLLHSNLQWAYEAQL